MKHLMASAGGCTGPGDGYDECLMSVDECGLVARSYYDEQAFN